MTLSYRNHFVDLGWFLYDKDLRHERVESALAASFCWFSFSFVPISYKFNSNGTYLFLTRSIIFALQPLAHIRNVAPETFPQLTLINSSITLFFHLFRGVISSSNINIMPLSIVK